MSELQSILYVEDDADIREVAQLSLEDIGGYTLKTCASGHEALDIIDAFHPDLVLLDVMMPEMDGVETLQALREQGSLDNIPVLFMTAKVHPEEMARYHELNVADVIAKPFDPMTLPDQINRAWKQFHGQ